MKIAVVAANGRAAGKIIEEAVNRGFDVTAFGRGAENKTAASNYVQKDIMDLTKEDLAGFDAVVDGFGA
ncbi:MAG: NAD(P)-dependent oxidoreductase, partial [Flexilinea sp.]|nr:NAD(P)-dependent oxidoreductase [Flexilinea sp.]